MHSCPSCQAEMLEFLYDLLDDSERQAIQAHLEGCAACRAALAAAKGQQQLLAAAARMEFPDVHFAAPTGPAPKTEASARAPAVVPMPQPTKKAARPWPRWAAAAAILLALAAVGAPGYWMHRDYAEAGKTVADRKADAAAAKQKMTEAVAQIQSLPGEERKQIEDVYDAERACQLKLAVVGPATMAVGAPTTYEIQTANLNDKLVEAKSLTAQVVGADKRQIGDSIPVVTTAEKGKYRITLPADLPVKADARPVLVVSAKADSGLRADVTEALDLVAPVYSTYLDTDKPMYQPGEVVHFRSLTLDRFSLKPAEEDLRLTFELVTPTSGKRILLTGVNGLRDLDGAPVLGLDKKPLRGVGAGEVLLDPNLEGGEYILVCREESNRFPEQHRKFLVNNYAKPQLNKKLDYSRSTYGPGDEVAATCKAVRANGDPVRNQPVEATVLIDDKKYGADGKDARQPVHFQTDDTGTVVVRFKLPAEIARGEASLGVKFLGNPVETITRPLPIVLKKLNVEFYPEGGDLAADLPNRVYFQVRTPLGKPADLKGRLFEDGQPLSVAVETLHDEKEPGVNQGMGRFEFTPKSGKKYELQIDSPVGIADRVGLPEVKEDRVVLSLPDGVADAGKPIKAVVRSKTERDLMVGLYCRGRLLQSVRLKKGETEAILNPEAGAGGVCRVTVFEEKAAAGDRRELKPVAERLIYRRPAEFLTVNLRPDQSSYVPGQLVKLGVETLNEKGEPAPAVAMLAVVDKSILTLADEKTYRSMPTHFLLTSEVRRPEDLEYADFLLGPQAKAMEALDLLLGVQGWRRFAEQDPSNFRKNTIDKEEAERLLVMTGDSPRRTDLVEEEIRKVRQDTDAKVERLTHQYDQANIDERSALTDPAYATATTKTASYEQLLERARVLGTPLVGTALLVAVLACLVLGLRNSVRRAVPWYVGAAACAALLVAAVQWYRMGEKKVAPQNIQMAELTPSASTAAPPNEDERALWPDVDAMDGAARWEAEGLRRGAGPAAQFDLAKAADAPVMAPVPGGFAPLAAGGAPPADKRPGLGGQPFAVPEQPGDAKPAVAALLNGPDVNAPEAADRPNEQQLFARGGVEIEKKVARDAAGQGKADGLALDGKAKGEARLWKDMKEGDRDEARRALLWERNVEQLNRQRQFGAADGKAGGLRAPAPTMVVREFAHQREPGATPELRSDFAETLYWHPVLILPDGKADISFDLCDSATTFQAAVFAHTLDGRLGAGVKVIESRLPFTLQPAVPIEVTASDKIDVPLSVANNTADRRDVQLALKTHTNLSLLTGKENDRFGVDAGKTARPIYRFQPTIKEGEAVLEFAGKTDPFAADAVRARFHVVPEGFPAAESRSDVLEGSASQTVTLPETWVKGTLKCQVQVYPSTLADLQKGLDSLLREPNGCFEQTSTSNYPNLLILDYLKESDQTKPDVERRARELLSRGYQKLTSFECINTAKNARQGYEWFGGTAPAHEALTAYGLLQFRDMAKVQDVDPVMLKRTQEYLMSRRDNKGGFERNPRALDSFGRAPDEITNAYIVWALTESGKDDDLTKELSALAEQAKTSKDPYFLSLVAISLINRARTEEGAELLKTVAGVQKADGHLDAEKTSITGSGGRDLEIETTGLAVLGWLKANPGAFNANLQKAVKWIGQQRGGYGGFGSTQSTILALKALIAYTKANKRTVEGGELRLYVGDKEAAKLSFAAGASDALTLELKDAETVLHPGKNDVRVEITGKNLFPYTLAWTYQTLKPVAADDCPVRLDTKLSQTAVQEGDLVRLNVTLENVSGKGQSMATAVLGLPGGLIVPEDMKQLKQYCREPEDGSRPLVSAFEIRGRELVLYWRDLAPGQKIQVPLDLIARVPGEYSGPASRGYLYYNADHKHWVDPLKVVIAAKAE